MGSSIGKGQDLGYSYSKEDKSDWRNAIDFTTDGKLVNWIVAGKISQYGFIIVDEAHEGSENIKTILRLLNDRMGLYPNLKVVILSATIDTEEFQRYFAGQGASIIEFAGKARYDSKGNEISPPVRNFAPEEERLPYEDPAKLAKPLMQKAREKAKWLVEEIVSGRKDRGDILIFLHGKNPINQLVGDLKAWVQQDERLSRTVEVYPLYRTENDEEDLTFVADEDPKPGKIRIIVSTNIAEASVTIDSLVYEIETGVEIQPQFKAEIGANEYPMTLISRANATQRFGRVGRTKNGEVYTLYTEQQFNELFREQPLDVLERSNLEDILLKVKAAGIPNVQTGWLGNAPKEEIDRSTKQLVDSNILTAEGSLTSYGALVRVFSYPPRLIDMLMAADDLGCSVEMATILPVIKNDGIRRLLSWRFNWDAYTKRTAFRRHSALMAGCRDDVEFILKLYKAWDELSWLDQNPLRELSKGELNTLRKQWADIHFVNHKVMLAISKDREEALERLGVSTKEEGSRPINLSQINRVRALLRSMLTEAEVVQATNPYRYVADIEPQTGTLATSSLISDEQRAVKPDSWLEIPALEEERDGTFSRLFVDQVYPIGYRFSAKVERYGEGCAWIKTTRNMTQAQAPAQQTVSLTEDEEEEPDNEVEDELLEIEEPHQAAGISLADISTWCGSVNCKQAVRTSDPLTEEVVVEITDFYFETGQPPLVIAKVVLQPEPFDIFSRRHRYSDHVTVEVDEVLQFAGDYSAALVVRDVETNLEVLVEPQDMSFTRQAQAVTQIPVNSYLTLNVENIDLEGHRVRLTNWEKVEAAITNRFVTTEGDNETTVAKANVVDVHDDGKVMFALDLGKPSPDVCVIASVYGDKLPKTANGFSIGEQAALKVYRKSRGTTYAELARLPTKAQSSVGKEDQQGELSWRQGTLRFTGRITYDKLYELKTLADRDIGFQRALEKLYWHANHVYVVQFVDSELFAHMQTALAVGTVVDKAIVVGKNPGGVVVELGRELKGFVPRSKIMGGRGDLRLVTVGSTVQVRVLEHRIEKGQPLLEIIGGIAPPAQLTRGNILEGVVASQQNYGYFVTIAPGLDGLLRHANIPEVRTGFLGLGGKKKPTIAVGMRLQVKIISIGTDRKNPNKTVYGLEYVRQVN